MPSPFLIGDRATNQLIFFKKKVYYENKKESSRNVRKKALIVSNHRSLMDYMVTIFLFHFRRTFCLMSELVFSHGPFVSFFTKVMGGVEIDRRNYDFSFINKSIDMLDKNKMLIVYPEGKVSTNKKLNYFHPTYLLISLRTDTPITPVFTNGDYSLFKRTHLVIGNKINLRDYCKSKNPTKEELNMLNDIVVNKMNELEILCHKKMIEDKYGHNISLKYLLKDMGRGIAKFISSFFHMKFRGNLDLRNVKGGGVVVMNHTSFKDPLMLYKIFKHRRVYVLTAEIVFDGHKFRSYMLRQLGCVRIDRNIYDKDAIDLATDIVKAGNLLVIFAQGHIDKTNSLPFKSGAALVARAAKAPIYTVKIKPLGKKNYIYLGSKYDTVIDGNVLNSRDLKQKMNEIQEEIYHLGEDNEILK